MNHILQRTFDATPGKGVTSTAAAWLVGAMLVLAVIVGMAALHRNVGPSQARSLASNTTVTTMVPKPRKIDESPARLPTEPALTEEDIGMTRLRPHGG
jgi:hypothetical protein